MNNDELVIPDFLNRKINPHLTMTREERRRMEEKERADIAAERERQRLERELSRTKRKLELMRRRPIEPGSVSEKIAASLERKLARLDGRD